MLQLCKSPGTSRGAALEGKGIESGEYCSQAVPQQKEQRGSREARKESNGESRKPADKEVPGTCESDAAVATVLPNLLHPYLRCALSASHPELCQI